MEVPILQHGFSKMMSNTMADLQNLMIIIIIITIIRNEAADGYVFEKVVHN